MMGLMDREYKQELDRPRPFTPPPERPGTLSKVLIFLVVLFLLFLAADWKLSQQVNKRSNPQPQADAEATRPVDTSASTLPQTPAHPYPPDASGNTRTVTKCVVSGKTSYGDVNCGASAKATQLVTKENHNLMAAVRVPATVQVKEPPSLPSAVAQADSGADYAAMKAKCKALDEHIKYLDALGRQPQSPQTQDWIRDERKKARDRQARIPCR